jgi:nicotinamidase-related amidase
MGLGDRLTSTRRRRGPPNRKPLDRVNRLADVCRDSGIMVVHTAHVLRPDGSNTGVLGELVPAVLEEGLLFAGSRTAALHEGLVVRPEDIVASRVGHCPTSPRLFPNRRDLLRVHPCTPLLILMRRLGPCP